MILDSFLNFLELDKSTLRKNKTKQNVEQNENKSKEEEIECEEQNCQILEKNEIIEKDNMQVEIKMITEIIPVGNKKAIKRTKTQENILKR